MRTSGWLPVPVGTSVIQWLPPAANDWVKTTWRLVDVDDLVEMVLM